MPQSKMSATVSHLHPSAGRVSEIVPRPAPDGVSSHEASMMLAALENMKQQLQALESAIATRPSAPHAPTALEMELTLRERVLRTIIDAGEISTVDLADRLSITKQQVHWYVDGFEENGLTETLRGKLLAEVDKRGRKSTRRGPDVVRYIGPASPATGE